MQQIQASAVQNSIRTEQSITMIQSEPQSQLKLKLPTKHFPELSDLYASKTARELTLQLDCPFEKPQKEDQRYQQARYRELIPRPDHWYNNGVLKSLEKWRNSREPPVFVAYGPYGGVHKPSVNIFKYYYSDKHRFDIFPGTVLGYRTVTRSQPHPHGA